MRQDSPPPKNTSPKPVFLILLASVVAAISAVIFLGRSSVFVPNTWFSVARPFVWLAVSALMIASIALRMHFMKGPKDSFSKYSVLIIMFSILMGFMAQEVMTGGASLLNTFGAKQAKKCFVLTSIKSNPSGNLQRVIHASVRLPADKPELSRSIRFVPGSADLSLIKEEDSFDLEVLEGTFGYTALDGQRPKPGCVDHPQGGER